MIMNYDVKMIFAQRLKELINEKGITAKRLSEEVGVPYSTISDWLNLKTTPIIIHIPKIALFFKVSTDYLLGLEN